MAPKSKRVTVWEFLSEAIALASCRNRLTPTLSLTTSRLSTFNATMRCKTSCSALYTTPMPPLPTLPIILYLSTILPTRSWSAKETRAQSCSGHRSTAGGKLSKHWGQYRSSMMSFITAKTLLV